MPYTILIKRQADRALKKLGRVDRIRIAEKIKPRGDAYK